MDDLQTQSKLTPASTVWQDWRWLVLLFAFVVPLRGWLLVNTEVLARDSVGYIRYALRFEENTWGDVLRSFDQHPGYPAAIWLISQPMRALAGETTPEVMRLSAQLVSALAAILLVVPLFYLGKSLWDVRVGFGGVLLFECLPLSGRHLADGISESLFVCFVAWSLVLGVWSIQTRQARWFAGCGLAAGFAYLTRPEGVIVLAAVGLVLLAMQWHRAARQPWGQFAAQTVSLVGPALLIGSLYFVPTGRFTNKPSINHLMAKTAPCVHPAEPAASRAVLTASLWADSFIQTRAPSQRLLRGVWALIDELSYALYYIGCVPLVIGIVWRGRAILRRRAGWLLAAYFCLHAGALLLLAATSGYLSDRHLMPLIMLLCCLVTAGLLQFAEWVAAWKAPAVHPRFNTLVTAAALAILALEVLVGMPRTLKRLHGNREGNHDAGLWLAERVRPGDLVLDDHDWSNYYAGLMLLEGREPAASPDYQPTCYIVITRSNDPKVAALRNKREREYRYSQSAIVYRWPPSKPVEDARIVIHALPRNPQTHPWRVAKN